MESRIRYLEKKVSKEIENKYWINFEKRCQYLGNGVYSWLGILATDTRELFLLGCCAKEKIKIINS